jgi:hypothetical protein
LNYFVGWQIKIFMKHEFLTASNAGRRWLAIKAQRRGAAAFTLVDAMMASGIMTIFVGACLTAIFVNQISVRKCKEEALVMDFLTKYVENVKALPFDSVAPGLPLSGLYSITIPANTNWVSLTNLNYLQFHSELGWLQNRNPQLQVEVKPRSVSGTVHDKIITLKCDWDPPLKKGRQLEVQVDFLRTVDVPTL